MTGWAHRCAGLLTFAAALVLAGCGGSGGDRPAARSSSEQLPGCRSIVAATEQLIREHPEAPVAELRRMAAEVCRTGVQRVPDPPPEPVRASPGCDDLVKGRARPLPRREATPPEPPVPFFAARSGVLPPSGAVTVGGVQLPPGSPCPRHWATDEPVPDPAALAARLAAVFPSTGLWPVLWDTTWDGPDNYIDASGDPEAADRLNAATVLRQAWKDYGLREVAFPGLAPGAAGAGTGDVAADPFGTLARSWTAIEAPPDTGWVVMLVPANRPADVVSILGLNQTEIMSDAALTTVVRSWEQRFGAVLTTLGAGTLTLVVGAPPHTHGQAVRLAVEQAAFAPEDDVTYGPRMSALARQLRSGEPGREILRSRHVWRFGWPD